jgi:hypothetical protein
MDQSRIEKTDDCSHQLGSFFFDKVSRNFRIQVIALIVGKQRRLEFDAPQA